MRKLASAVVFCLGCSIALLPWSQGQGRGGGAWSTAGADWQLTGWQKSEARLTRANAKQIKYLWKIKLGSERVTQASEPLFGGRTLAADGFKDMAVIWGPANTLTAVDYEFGKILWQRQIGDARADVSANCHNGSPSAMVLQPPKGFTNPVAPDAGPASAGGGRGGSPAAPVTAAPAPVSAPPAAPRVGGNLGTPGVFAEMRGIFVLTTDGDVYEQTLTNGWAYGDPVKFTPPNVDAQTLMIAGSTLYATASGKCGQESGAVYALDMSTDAYPVASYKGNIIGTDGAALSTDEKTLYAVTGSASGSAPTNSVVALDAKTLQLKDYFTPSSANGTRNPDVSPVVFSYKGRDLVAAYVAGGRLALLDSSSLGGPDHHTPLAISAPISRDGAASWGRLASAATSTGTRFIYVSVQGPVATDRKLTANGASKDGAIVAFTVTEQGGNFALTPAWVSPNIVNPSPATIVMNAPFQAAIGRGAAAPALPASQSTSGGLLFTLAQGGASTHAKLYALDAETGRPIYSSGDELASSAKLASVAVSGAHVLFLTSDNTLYAYGIEYEKD